MVHRRTKEADLGCSAPKSDPVGVMDEIREYWNDYYHDLSADQYPDCTKEFFEKLEVYRFERIYYLPRIIDFSAYRGKRLLEVGCGIGIDLVRFAKHGAIVMGIDLADEAIRLAKKNFELHRLEGDLQIMNGENLTFCEESFDAVFAHSVIQYTRDPERMIHEIHRVLKLGGEAILMVYHRYSWFYLLSKLFGMKLEHESAPILRVYSIRDFRKMLSNFSRVEINIERFPVKTSLNLGWKSTIYNSFFVPAFNLIPVAIVRPFGWHLVAKVIK